MQTPWGKIQVGLGADIRAYDETGRCFSFWPIEEKCWRYALDVETREPNAHGYVSSALGPKGLASWVEVEVVAKLSKTPAHLVLRHYMAGQLGSILQSYKIEVLRSDTDRHWIAIGRLRDRG